MLEDFLIKHEIDILFLQEVTQPVFDNLRGYTAYNNTEKTRRGTAILAINHLTLTNILRLPTGRGLAADFQGVWLVNIYAPSGAEKRQEREDFFNFVLPYLLQATPNTVILGGDFNCVLAKADVTGHLNFSRALNSLVKGYNLVDMWTTAPERGVYTYYTRQGGSETGQNTCERKLQRTEVWDINDSD
jgi:exonuclease III